DRAAHAAESIASTSKLRDDVSGVQSPPMPLEHCPDMVATLLRFPQLWNRLAALSAVVQSASAVLPARYRQLAILRTVWLCGAPYQWGEHVERTRKAGVTNEEIEQVKTGSSAPGFGPADKAVLSAVEELHGDSFVSDETWSSLAARFDDGQMVELLVLVGQFRTIAGLLNSIRMPLEPWNTGFLERESPLHRR
ncbi:MAG: carboxymuconolactone decarboxylase family protein, partial [Parvularculaceae bacterium]|nr:carboxymuconolactone decarboxylase family protein [Parvularculaceae bacterium]